MRRSTRLTLAASALVFLAGSAPPSTPPTPRSVEDTPVALRFVDMPVAKVLSALFAATGARASIDPCATGRITIELRNVTMGTALDSIARIADLDVKRSDGPVEFRVGCRSAESRERRSRAAPTSAGAVALRFRIERLDSGGASQMLAERELSMNVGEKAEASEAGQVPDLDLSDDGEIFVASRRPEWRLRAVVTGVQPGMDRQLCGIFEISRTLDSTFEPAVSTESRPFRIPVPEGVGDVEAARVELAGSTYVLWASVP